MSSNGLSRTNIEKKFAKKNAEGEKTTDKSRNEKRSIAGIEECREKRYCVLTVQRSCTNPRQKFDEDNSIIQQKPEFDGWIG